MNKEMGVTTQYEIYHSFRLGCWSVLCDVKHRKESNLQKRRKETNERRNERKHIFIPFEWFYFNKYFNSY